MNAAKLALLNMAGYKVSQQGRDKLYVPIVGEKGVRYRGTFDTPAAAIASGRPVHFDTWASFEACAEFLNNKLDGGSAVAGIAAVANLNPNPRKSRMWLQLILVGALFALLAVALLAVDTTVVALLAVALPAVALPVVLLHPTPVALTSVKRCVSFGHFLYMFFLLVGVGVLAALLAVDPQGAQVPTWMVLNDGLLLTLSVFFIYSLASSTTSLYHSAHVYEDALKKDSWVATNLSLTQTQRKMGAHNRGTLERLKKEGVGRAPPWPALMRTLNTTGCWISPVNVNVATLVEWMGSGDGELPRNYSDGASSRRIGGFSDFESVVDPHNQASQKRWTRRIHDRSAAELAVTWIPGLSPIFEEVNKKIKALGDESRLQGVSFLVQGDTLNGATTFSEHRDDETEPARWTCVTNLTGGGAMNVVGVDGDAAYLDVPSVSIFASALWHQGRKVSGPARIYKVVFFFA